MKHKIITISSVFPTSAETIWEKLQRLDTLQYIASPLATFHSLDKEVLTWSEGEAARFELKLFGFIPFGIHIIKVKQFDRNTYRVYTNEGNKYVPVWNHKIWLDIIDECTTKYTDEVEIFAGWKTIFVYWWSYIFYKHRQKKWFQLIRKRSIL
jgi:hypothetical protein